MIWDSQQEYTGILVFPVWKCSIWTWDVCFLGMYCIERQGIHHPQLCGSEGAKSNTSPFDPWVQWCATSSLGTLRSVSTPNRYQGTLVPWFFFFFTHASSFVLCVGFSIFSSFERSRRVIIASQWGRWFFFSRLWGGAQCATGWLGSAWNWCEAGGACESRDSREVKDRFSG